MVEARTYRFSDSQRPGLVLGLSARQAIPLAAGILGFATVLQTSIPPLVGAIDPVLGIVTAFGRWRGAPVAETLVPGTRLAGRRLRRRNRWYRPPLLGDNTDTSLPGVLKGLELIESASSGGGGAMVRDRKAGTLSSVIRIHGHGFPLASSDEQDSMLSAWAAALSPFSRERSPVASIAWQEWAHPVTSAAHGDFLASVGIRDRSVSPAAADYLALIEHQAPVTVAHDVLLTITVDLRRIRARRSARSRLTAAVEVLVDEVRLFTSRLEAAGLLVEPPLGAIKLSAAIRTRSDPARGQQLATLTRSLAAAAGRGALEWGPMVSSPTGHTSVSTVRSIVRIGWRCGRSCRSVRTG